MSTNALRTNDELALLERKLFEVREGLKRRLNNAETNLTHVSELTSTLVQDVDSLVAWFQEALPALEPSAKHFGWLGPYSETFEFSACLTLLLQVSASQCLDLLPHSIATAACAIKLLELINLDPSLRHRLLAGSMLHDIGVGFLKSDRLTPISPISFFERHPDHTLLGARLIQFFPVVERESILKIIRSHHERWNGSGFPDRLQGNAIPLEARIVGICEIFNIIALKFPVAEVAESRLAALFQQQSGVLFDPLLAEAIVRNVHELYTTNANAMAAARDFFQQYWLKL